MEKSNLENFLPEKYPDLAGSPPVERAVQAKLRAGEKGPQTKEARVEAYLDRIERLILDPNKEQPRVNERKTKKGEDPRWLEGNSRPRAILLLRDMVMEAYVRPNKEKMAQGAARVEERAAREMGIDAHYGEQELEQRGEIAVKDLEKSLDNWILYLSDMNEPYPTWFRYYAFRNILTLGDYDKDKAEFTKRSPGSTRLFPDIDRGALAYVEQMIEASMSPEMLKRLGKAQEIMGTPHDQLITQEKAAQFAKLSFAKQYAEGIKQAGEITPEMRAETRGNWIKYQQGTDPTALWASLQNKGTAWCTKGFATAETQLQGGDFYVYYTQDTQGNPTIPRIAIRTKEGNIAELRGVADNDQNLEGNMVAIAEEKMKELPGAEQYRKASSDMKTLTAIERRTNAGEDLTKDDLIFLYEIDSKIEGFGYQDDPRIQELRSQRNSEEDMLIVFECARDQIARNPKEINKGTKAYVGKLEPGIFDLVQQYNIEYIYTSFPEGRIRKETIEIGGKSPQELVRALKDAHINLTDYAQYMIKSKDFVVSTQTESVDFVRLKVQALGLSGYPTTEQIYQRAKELGLELCPPEVGPHYRLQYIDQPLGEWFDIAMKQIVDRGGHARVFRLGRHGGGLWLDDYWTNSTYEWDLDGEVVFRLRPRTKAKLGAWAGKLTHSTNAQGQS